MGFVALILIIFKVGYLKLYFKRGCLIYYKFGKKRRNKLQKCKVGFLFGLKESVANFADPGSHRAEFFKADLGRFLLEIELMCGGTIDQIGVFEYMGCNFIHGAGFDQRLDQTNIVRPFQKTGIPVGIQ